MKTLKEKHDIEKNVVLASRIIGIIAVCFFILTILVGITFSKSNYAFENELKIMNAVGTCSYNGGEPIKIDTENSRNYFLRKDSVEFNGHLKKDLLNKTIYVHLYYCDFKMYKNDVLIMQSNDKTEYFNSDGDYWIELNNVNILTTDDIRIEISSDYNIGFTKEILYIYYGNPNILYENYVVNNSFPLVQSLCLLIMGCTVALFSVVVRKLFRKKIFSLSLFIIVAALWSVVDSAFPYFSLLMHNRTVAGLLDFGLVFFLPITYEYYFLTNMTKKQNIIIASSCLIASTVVAVFAFLFQLFKIYDLMNVQYLFIIVSTITTILVGYCVIEEYRYKKNKHILYITACFIPTFISLILELINRLVYQYFDVRVFPRLGFMVTSILLLFLIADYIATTTKIIDDAKKLEIELQDNKMKVLLSQIQPHFLYNVLGTIDYLCEVDTNKAQQAIRSLSKFLRGNIDSISKEELVLIDTELDYVRNYLDIEAMRFGSRLNVVYDIKTLGFMIPTITIQPLVENAVRCGITKKENGGTITISTYSDEYFNYITVQDDGVGFNVNEPNLDNSRTHIGISNAKTRIEKLLGGDVLIESTIGVGTKITIKLVKEGNEIVCS